MKGTADGTADGVGTIDTLERATRRVVPGRFVVVLASGALAGGGTHLVLRPLGISDSKRKIELTEGRNNNKMKEM